MQVMKIAVAITALAVGSIGCVTSATAIPSRDIRSAVASAEPPADCSEAAQVAGECIGWAGAAGADPAAAAIASSLLLGKSASARKFFDNHRAEISSTTQNLITQAFATETSAGAEAAARVLAPLVFPPTSTSTGSGSTHGPDASQISNGETRATGYYKWVLHGSTQTQIYYGYTNSSGSHTLGSLTADLEAHTYFQDTGAHWYMDVVHSSGVRPYLSSNVERIYQDVTLGSDPVKSTLPCYAAGYTLNCNVYSKPSMTTGNWYYFQAKWTNNPSGYPASSVQVQTRRWKVVTSANWQFLAYGNGG